MTETPDLNPAALPAKGSLLLKGGHVIDPASGLDHVTDVLITDGTIAAIGDAPVPPGTPTLDLTGSFVSPGWIDMHMHAYGSLGFAHPDLIGVWQGVTSFVDAGGPGIGVMDEFIAMMGPGRLATDLYAGPYIRPLGIIGAQFTEGDVRTLGGVPLDDWLAFMDAHPGIIRYLKVAGLSGYGGGPITLGKGLAEILGIPLYGHIGEYQMQPEDPCAYRFFEVCGAGDIVAHVYHANGAAILDEDGRLLPVVRDAQKRGALFDIAFGSYNFDWDLAEKAFAQDLRPHITSSDLQQFSAIGPTYSLAHVMGIVMHLGLTRAEMVEQVTLAPAKAIGLTDRAGRLAVGLPADITVFDMEEGEFELMDTGGKMRTGQWRFHPRMAFKRGHRFDCDMTRCQDESNWLVQIAEDHVPEAAARLNGQQREFLGALAGALAPLSWSYSLETLDLKMVQEMQAIFQRLRKRHGLELREALLALYACFLDSPFAIQSGLFLMQQDRDFALSRLNDVAGPRRAAAE